MSSGFHGFYSPGAKSCGFTGLVLLQGAFDASDEVLVAQKKYTEAGAMGNEHMPDASEERHRGGRNMQIRDAAGEALAGGGIASTRRKQETATRPQHEAGGRLGGGGSVVGGGNGGGADGAGSEWARAAWWEGKNLAYAHPTYYGMAVARFDLKVEERVRGDTEEVVVAKEAEEDSWISTD